MNEKELIEQEKRLNRYRGLRRMANELQCALDHLSKPWPEGTHPFDANAKEPRAVTGLRIFFSASRGGAAPVTMDLTTLNIDAPDFGQAIETLIRKKLHLINAEIEKL